MSWNRSASLVHAAAATGSANTEMRESRRPLDPLAGAAVDHSADLEVAVESVKCPAGEPQPARRIDGVLKPAPKHEQVTHPHTLVLKMAQRGVNLTKQAAPLRGTLAQHPIDVRIQVTGTRLVVAGVAELSHHLEQGPVIDSQIAIPVLVAGIRNRQADHPAVRENRRRPTPRRRVEPLPAQDDPPHAARARSLSRSQAVEPAPLTIAPRDDPRCPSKNHALMLRTNRSPAQLHGDMVRRAEVADEWSMSQGPTMSGHPGRRSPRRAMLRSDDQLALFMASLRASMSELSL